MNEISIMDPLDVTEAQLLPDAEVRDMLNRFELPSLPQYNFKVRPPTVAIHRREACAALVEARGNIKLAADLLKTNRARLSGFIKRDTFTSHVLDEVLEYMVDDAREVVYDTMLSNDPSLAYQAAKFILTNSKQGKARGFGEQKGVNINAKDSSINISWIDPTDTEAEYFDPSDAHKVVDVTPEEGDPA